MQKQEVAPAQVEPVFERLEDVEGEMLGLLESNPRFIHLPSVLNLLRELKELRRLMATVRADIRKYEAGEDLSRKI